MQRDNKIALILIFFILMIVGGVLGGIILSATIYIFFGYIEESFRIGVGGGIFLGLLVFNCLLGFFDINVVKIIYIFSLTILIFGIVLGVLVDVILVPKLFGYTTPGSLGWGTFFGTIGTITLLLRIDLYFFNILPGGRKSKPEVSFWDEVKVEKAEEKDDYKNLGWLRHQHYELGKSIQDIANEQGVSMIVIRKWLDKHKTCPYCGSIFIDNLKFCGKCGKPLNN